MFGTSNKIEVQKLNTTIDRILTDMIAYGPDSPEYPTLVAHLDQLIKLRNARKREKLSSDAMLTGGANLLGILIIVMYEQKHVWVSKASSFIGKAK